MSKQYTGGLITKTPVVPTSLSASGVWSLSDQAEAQATNTWPFPRDPQFNYVTMLLHGDGSAGPVAMGSGAGTSSTVTAFNTDASTNNFNIAINGDARSNNFNPYQSGYYSNYFDGSGDYLTAPSGASVSGTGAFTVEFWAYFTTSQSYSRPVSGGANQFTIDLSSSGEINYGKAGVNNIITGNVGTVLGAWCHIVVARSSGGTARIWANGASIGTATDSNNYTAGTVYIGSTSTPSFYLTGYLSNLRTTNTDVYGTSNTTITVPTSPLTAVSGTSLLTCQSNRFIDNSTNAFAITVSGNTSIAPTQPFTLPSSVATYGSGYFDGTGDYLSAPSVPASGTGSFCFEAWIYPTNASTNQMIIGAVNGGMWVGMNIDTANNFSIGRAFTANDNGVSFTWANNRWYHVAVNRNGTSLQFFVDGVQIGSTLTNSINYSVAGRLIAAEGTTAATFYSGYIAGLRVVNASVYTSAFTPPTAPPSVIANTTLLTTQFNGGGNNSGFKDSSQNNFVITRNGNTTQGTFTPYSVDWSNYFNGSSDYFSLTDNGAFNFGTGDATVEYWFNSPGTSSNYPGIISSVDYNASGSASIRFDNTGYKGKAFMYVNGGGDPVISSTTTISYNTWNHIAIVRQGTSLKLYLNGTLDTTVTISVSLPWNLSNGGMRIGRGFDVDGASAYYPGYLSNLRLVKGTAVYTSNFTPSATPLTAISNTSLLTCQSSRFVDNSIYAFTLTVNSAPSVQGFSPFAPLTVYNPATYGGSMYGDGSGDYLTIANNAAFQFGSGAFTVECWFFAISTGSNQGIVGKWADGQPDSNAAWDIDIQSGSIRAILASGSTVTSWTGTALTANTWNHVAFVRNGSNTVSLFLNGSRVATQSYSSTVNNGANDVYVSSAYVNNRVFTGYISDARVVKGTAVYDPTQTTYTVPTAPLTAVTGTSLLVSATNPAILDNAMMNNLETVGNAQISTSVVKYGTASMYFDGTGDYLQAPNNPNFQMGSGSFTIEMWLYIPSLPSAYKRVFSITNPTVSASTDESINFEITNTNKMGASVVVSSTFYTVTDSSDIPTNTWTHWALVRNGTSLVLYRDGTSVSSTTATGSANFGTTFNLYIGRWVGSSARDYNGYIDDLRITKGVARYTANFTAPTQAFPNG